MRADDVGLRKDLLVDLVGVSERTGVKMLRKDSKHTAPHPFTHKPRTDKRDAESSRRIEKHDLWQRWCLPNRIAQNEPTSFTFRMINKKLKLVHFASTSRLVERNIIQ